jgi:predicted short-subunit dehydrogenase-like oxidoreductase (DUF2520 family)
MRIVILGSGNVATVLGRAIKNASHDVLQIYDRNILKANVLANELASVGIDDWQKISLEADIYLMALSDGAILEAAKNLHLQKGILLHTAGAVSINVFEHSALHYGVLYPLQSLRKEKNAYQNIPLLVDGSSADVLSVITIFAKTISSSVTKATDEERLKLHVAAVVVSNFTNYLYSLAEDYCQKEKVPFAMLQPLIIEVAQRLQGHTAAEMQTGPAIRKDLATIEKHTELLKNYPDLQEVYTFMSKKIMVM